MKKTILILLALLLCLGLCACGGMSAGEAAQTYPHIIGGWGTDPFGEDFALLLAEDGSCTMMEAAGTWTLDTKSTDGNQVELLIKTENGKYTARLSKIPNEPESVANLQIVDSKGNAQIFYDKVSRNGYGWAWGNGTTQQYSDLYGSWGTDPFGVVVDLELEADGSCRIFDVPGRWAVNLENTDEAMAELVAVTESAQYVATMGRSEEMAMGTDVKITDVAQNVVVYDKRAYLAEERYASYELALQEIPELIGSWGSIYLYEDPVITLREDGTCVILGEEGKWCLEREIYRGPESKSSLRENFVRVAAQLNTGETRQCPVQIWYSDLLCGSVTVYNDTECLTPHVQDQSYAYELKREDVESIIDQFSWILGSWFVQGETEATVTFRADGSCILLGEEGVWGRDYLNYHHADDEHADYVEFGEKHGYSDTIIVKINHAEYSVFLDERYGFIGVNEIFGEEIVPFSNAVKR